MSQSELPPLTIVGIGASVGGQAALLPMLRQIPPDSNLVFIVAFQGFPEQESHLADLLQPHVDIPVQQVSGPTLIKPNRVYLLPPGRNLSTMDAYLRLSDLREDQRERAPIDHFFRTLASTYGGNTVGVVLSGAGSDGALGIKEIQGQGGLTIAQDPEEAEYEGMPKSAVASGSIDLILPLSEMIPAILRFTQTNAGRDAPNEMQAANEALQPMKEATEELATELSTRNQENRHRVEELPLLTSDLLNFFSATNIATLFLDRSLRITRYTPRMGELLNIGHLGRPLSELTHRLGNPILLKDAQQVLEKLLPVKREIQDNRGNWFMTQILPYRRVEDRIEELVIIFIDITEQKIGEEAMRIFALQNQFLTMLSDTLRALSDPQKIQAEAARLLGEYLNASRVHYAEVINEGEYGIVYGDYHRGVPSVVGRHRFDDYGALVMDEFRAGKTLVISDVQNDSRLSATEKEATAKLQIGAYIIIPLVKGNRPVALLTVHFKEAHQWRPDEIQVIEETADRTWAATERAYTEIALKENESRYRTLFNSIDEGFCILEVIFDKTRKPVDYRFLEVNPTFERHTGLVSAVGKTALELVPNLEDHWMETYGRVALTGKSERFVAESPAMGRWFEVEAFPIGGEPNQVGLLFTDITEQKHNIEAISKSEARFRSLADAMPQLVWVANSDGVVNYYNSRRSLYKGLKELQEGVWAWEPIVHPDDREATINAWTEAVKTKGGYQIEHRIGMNDDTYRWHLSRAYYAYAEDGYSQWYGTATDIHDLKQIQEDLRLSEERLRQALESAQLGTWTFDPASQETHFDERCLEIFGVDKQLLQPEEVMALIHPEDRALFIRSREEALGRGNPDNFEETHRIVRPNGEIRWVRGHAHVFFQEKDGARLPIRAVGVIADVTDQVKAQQELQNSKERLRIATNAAGLGIFEWDAVEDSAVWENDRMFQIFGRNREESPLTKTEFFECCIHPDDAAAYVQAYLESIQSRSTFHRIFRILKPDGTLSWLEVTADFTFDNQGKPIRQAGVVADITERKNAEEALREREEHLQIILSSAREYAIFTTDPDRKITDWNTGAERIFGYSKEEVLGQSSDLVFVPEERGEAPVKEVEIAVKEGRAENERWHIRKNGSRFWASGLTMPLKDAQDQLRGFLSIMVDDTERRHMERDLHLAKEQAERAARAKTDFLAHMSHEIRTPLNVIIGLAMLLESDPREDQIESVELLKFSAQNLRTLIDDILDFSKIQAGQLGVQEKETHLRALLRSLEKAHWLRARDQGIEFRIEVDERIPATLRTDELKLSQILNNLINNAIKFTLKGEVVVEVGLKQQEGEQLWIDFSISDTGIGIPQEKLDIIFDAFTQVDNSTVRNFEGTGLGLSITKSLLDLLGSRIEVESEENKGSRFFFTLPVKQSEAGFTEIMAGGFFENVDLSNLRILLVEDVSSNRTLFRKFLKGKWNIQVEEANNGKEAVERVRSEMFDLILMDIRMPVMDGYEATRIIRGLPDPNLAKIPIIALTADTLQEVERHPEAALFSDLITKPFQVDDLLEKIRRYGGGKKEL